MDYFDGVAIKKSVEFIRNCLVNDYSVYIGEINAKIADAFQQHYLIIGLLSISILIGLAILWNQRKIKKMLRDLNTKEPTEDKP